MYYKCKRFKCNGICQLQFISQLLSPDYKPTELPPPRLKAHMKPLMNICTHSAQAWDFTVYETVIRKTAKKTTVISLY